MDIVVEQLVYGSFPFWDRGYDVLARSPGCRPDWVADVLSACRKYGEAPSGVMPVPALFSLRLPSGPRAIVGVEPQGHDDRGRPGALAFHALLVTPRDYRRAGSDPFAFEGAIRRDWSAETALEALSWTIAAPDGPSPWRGFSRRAGLALPRPSGRQGKPCPTEDRDDDPRVPAIVRALGRGRAVALESPGPIDSLARDVWSKLPESVRRRASVATWAFGNGNAFDLVALPRLAGVELGRSYVDPTSLDAEPPRPARPPRRLGTLTLAGLAVVLGATLAWRALVGTRPSDDPQGPTPASPVEPEALIGPVERSRIVDDLMALADRFEVGGSNDPGELMARISREVRYRGPTLSLAELSRLADEADPDHVRALEWHERLKAFADDRPLPDDFAGLPLDRQLEALARSFHLDPSTRPGRITGALLDALGRDGPVRPTPLASRYPALSDYARFLGKLPRLPDRKAAGGP